MEQLPLAMRLRERAVFDSYVAGPNAALVAQLRAAAAHRRAAPSIAAAAGGGMLWLTGPAGAGKTHLLQAVCMEARSAARSALYLPVSELLGLGPAALAAWQEADVVALDELERLIGAREWEQALFNLHREAEQRQALLLVAATQPPARLSFALPDLASRCAGALLLVLQPIDEAAQREALQRRARARGLELPEQTARYLQRRFRRDLPTLCRLLDTIDTASLQAQRRLTVPFIRAVLAPARSAHSA